MKAALTRFRRTLPRDQGTPLSRYLEDQIDTKVNAAVAAKQGPDVLFESDREGEFPRRGAIRDIPSDMLPPQYIKDHKFYEVRPLDDGKLYWVHTSIMGPILFANKALLRRGGPQTVKTRPRPGTSSASSASNSPRSNGDQMIAGGLRLQRLRALHLERHDVPAERQALRESEEDPRQYAGEQGRLADAGGYVRQVQDQRPIVPELRRGASAPARPPSPRSGPGSAAPSRPTTPTLTGRR